MNNINYRLELDKIISADSELSKKVLCILPCFSLVVYNGTYSEVGIISPRQRLFTFVRNEV